MNKLCTICMRGGSKGVPNKNLREIHGKPLMAYTIDQALQSELFEHVVVSTDSAEIAKVAKSFGAEVWFLRPAELASDEAPKLPAKRHALLESEKYFGVEFDIVFDLDSTSPLRSVSDIIGAYNKFLTDKAEILITVSPSRKNPYFNMVELINNHVNLVKKFKNTPLRRQDAPKVYDMNASIYIWKREALLKYDTLFTKNTSIYVMPEERSVDIDNEMDWNFVEYLIRKKLSRSFD